MPHAQETQGPNLIDIYSSTAAVIKGNFGTFAYLTILGIAMPLVLATLLTDLIGERSLAQLSEINRGTGDFSDIITAPTDFLLAYLSIYAVAAIIAGSSYLLVLQNVTNSKKKHSPFIQAIKTAVTSLLPLSLITIFGLVLMSYLLQSLMVPLTIVIASMMLIAPVFLAEGNNLTFTIKQCITLDYLHPGATKLRSVFQLMTVVISGIAIQSLIGSILNQLYYLDHTFGFQREIMTQNLGFSYKPAVNQMIDIIKSLVSSTIIVTIGTVTACFYMHQKERSLQNERT